MRFRRSRRPRIPGIRALQRVSRTATKRGRALSPRARARTRRRRAAGWAAAGLTAGAAATYFLDPDRGKARRHRVRDRSAALARQTGRRVARTGRYAGSTMAGTLRRIRHGSGDAYEAPNDQALAAKVKSEVLGQAEVPDSVTINVEQGIVVLRGTARDAQEIGALERSIRATAGVRGVDNLLRPEGEPAPNKIDAQRASRS